MTKRLSEIAEKPNSNFLDFLSEIEERITDEYQIDRDNIAFKIGYYMKKNGLTQKQLADKIGVKPQQVNRILKGKYDFKHSTLFKIQKALNIKLVDSKINSEEEEEETKIIVMKTYSSKAQTQSPHYISQEAPNQKIANC